jgi:hypothetical protein
MQTAIRLITALLLLFGPMLRAQTQSDLTATACDATQETLYGQTALGKPVLISLHALDCSSCRSQAADLGTFASANPNVRVWAAMGYLTTTNGAECTALASWASQYGWTNVFAFPNNAVLSVNRYPDYLVIDPRTNEIALRTSNAATARAKALELAALTSRQDPLQTLGIRLWIDSNGQVHFQSAEQLPQTATITAVDALGRQVWTRTLAKNTNNAHLDHLPQAGIYWLRVQMGTAQAAQAVFRP